MTDIHSIFSFLSESVRMQWDSPLHLLHSYRVLHHSSKCLGRHSSEILTFLCLVWKDIIGGQCQFFSISDVFYCVLSTWFFSLRHSHPWISFTSQCVIDVTFSWQTYFTLRLYYFFFLSSHPSAVSSLSSVFRHYSCSSFNTIRGWQRILMESWFSFLHTQF